MSVILGRCSHDTAAKLAAAVLASLGAVKALVNGRSAIVTANAWDLINDAEQSYEYDVRAELLNPGQGRNLAADAPAADRQTQELISKHVRWESWPSS